MYYNSEEIDEHLKCSICCKKFIDVVRLIPDCGEEICEHCYEDIKATVDDSGLYKCMACEDEHTMPCDGFREIKSLSRILKRSRIEKPLSDDAKLLKSTIASFEGQMRALKTFNERDSINQHCSQLELEVTEKIESVRKKLDEMEKDMFKQIGEYRKKCLDSWSARSTTTQTKDASIDAKDIEQELMKLREEIDVFSDRWAEYFDRIDILASDREIAEALEEARQFEKKMVSMQETLNSEALNGQIMKLVTKYSLICDLNALKKTITLTVHEDRKKHELRIELKPSRILTGHSQPVNHIVSLSDRKLASCSNDRTIRIWDIEKKSTLFELQGHANYVYSLALLSNGWLASASGDKTIKIWNLGEKKEIRTLEGHQGQVVWLKTPESGNLVSYSLDDTIKIWNPFSTNNNLLLTITGHGNTRMNLPFGITSNETLVTCSVENSAEAKSILRLWNPSDGQLIKSISVHIKTVYAFLVLSNDKVALGCQDGVIKIIDLKEGIEVASTAGGNDCGSIYSLAQLKNSDLVSCWNEFDSTACKISVWSIDDGGLRLVQSIESREAWYLNITNDGTLLATDGSKGSIKLWTIKKI